MTEPARSLREIRISVVVPLYNEEAVVAELRRRLLGVLEQLTSDFEVLLIDDGSSDGTAELIRAMHREDPRFKCVAAARVTSATRRPSPRASLRERRRHLRDGRRPSGPARDAGLRCSSEWEKGSDVVYAIRASRKEHWVKVALYDLFYRLLARLSTIPMPLDAGDFCLISRRGARRAQPPPREGALRARASGPGSASDRRASATTATRDVSGASKYSFFGLLRLAINGIVSFSDKPLDLRDRLRPRRLDRSPSSMRRYLALVQAGLRRGHHRLRLADGWRCSSSAGIQLLALGVVGLYLSARSSRR